jgi:biotin carboxyl carrier protein
MKRVVSVEGGTASIEIEAGRLRYSREGGETLTRDFSIRETAAGYYSVMLNGRSYRVTAGAAGQVVVNGRTLRMEVYDPRDWRAGVATTAGQGRQEVIAPMPGKIVRVLVKAGQEVSEGQGLIVVEAMKMQNEMKSPKTGRVVEVRGAADATVTAGQVLAVVE